MQFFADFYPERLHGSEETGHYVVQFAHFVEKLIAESADFVGLLFGVECYFCEELFAGQCGLFMIFGECFIYFVIDLIVEEIDHV